MPALRDARSTVPATVPSPWDRAWPALSFREKRMGAGKEGAWWWLSIPAQHHLAGPHPQIPIGPRVPPGTTPWGPGWGGTAHGDPAVGTSQAPAQKSLSPLPILVWCPPGASGSWEQDAGDSSLQSHGLIPTPRALISPPPPHPPFTFFLIFFFPSSINGWKCFRFWQRALDVAVSDGSRGLRPGNLWG